ncbi:MAG: glycosyltransferase family 2 protein [Candidatus Omnitrophica bacterium]|nr:glycosyltransferase family 2 protein [Candidatus Omnitrophota bacterium]
MNVCRKLAVIVPTLDRPEQLDAFLRSVRASRVAPSRVIIVESGSARSKDVAARYGELDIVHVMSDRGITVQRNIGIKNLGAGHGLVAFFDDDIELFPDTLEKAVEYFDKAPAGTAGASCNIVNHPRPKTTFFERFFLLGTDEVGRVLRSGFFGKICSADRDYKVEWLVGCATFWRREVLERGFDEWFRGYGHYEDVDFSYGVSREQDLFVLAGARVLHNTAHIEESAQFYMGKMQAANRIYFVKKHEELSIPLCYWACLGLFLKNILFGLFLARKKYLVRAGGVLAGIISAFFRAESSTARIKK